MLAVGMLGLGLAEVVTGEGLTPTLCLDALTSCQESPRAVSMGCSELKWQWAAASRRREEPLVSVLGSSTHWGKDPHRGL